MGKSQEIRFKASSVSSLLMIRLRPVILYLQAKLLEALPLKLVMLLYLRREGVLPIMRALAVRR